MKRTTTYLKMIIVLCMMIGAKNALAQCAAGFNITYNANGNVSLVSTSSSPSLAATSYTWDYGDSSPKTIGQQTTVLHNYPNGTYSVSLTIKTYSPAFCTDTLTHVVTVTNSPCSTNLIPNFSYSANSGTVTFNNTSLNTTSTTAFAWNFGDSNTSTAFSPVHTYAANGSYNVKLILTDGPCADTVAYNVNVVTTCTINPSFTYSYNVANSNYQFTNTSTNTLSTSSYTWNFGDGNYAYTNSPTHAYLTAGMYTITLSAKHNTAYCIATSIQTINATGSPTVPCALTANYTHTVGSGGQVNFSSSSTGASGSATYYWNFGDGFTGSGSNPSHTYSSAGAYNVMLYVNNQSNPACTDSIIQSVNVTGIGCVANSSFTMIPTATPQVWNVVPAYPWNVTAVNWNWGDNSNSNTLYTSHTYSAAGTYSICLSVTVSCGGTSQTCINQFISKSQQNMQMIQVNVVAPPAIALGLVNQSSESIDWSVYPNPNNGQFEIQMDNTTSESTKIKVYSLIGEMVYEAELTNENKKINLDKVSNGIYFIKLNSNNKEFTKKIIVNK